LTCDSPIDQPREYAVSSFSVHVYCTKNATPLHL
jgi:hypothetical protein